jgi:hypothetical protein
VIDGLFRLEKNLGIRRAKIWRFALCMVLLFGLAIDNFVLLLTIDCQAVNLTSEFMFANRFFARRGERRSFLP